MPQLARAEDRHARLVPNLRAGLAPHWLIWVMLTGIYLFDVIAAASSAHVNLSPAFQTEVLAGFASGLAIAMMFAALRPRLPAPAQNATDALQTLLLIALGGPAAAFFNALMSSWAFPLADGVLHGWDQAVGLDWVWYVDAMTNSPALATLLRLAYYFSMPVLFMISVAAAGLGKRDSAAELLFLFLTTLIVCTMIGVLVPAEGALGTLASDEMIRRITAAGGDKDSIDFLRSLRDPGHPITLKATNLLGVTCFPSFHTVSALLVAYAARGAHLAVRLLTYIFAAFVILSTPVFGGHYFIDLAAGALVFILAISARKRLSRYLHIQSQGGDSAGSKTGLTAPA